MKTFGELYVNYISIKLLFKKKKKERKRELGKWEIYSSLWSVAVLTSSRVYVSGSLFRDQFVT